MKTNISKKYLSNSSKGTTQKEHSHILMLRMVLVTRFPRVYSPTAHTNVVRYTLERRTNPNISVKLLTACRAIGLIAALGDTGTD